MFVDIAVDANTTRQTNQKKLKYLSRIIEPTNNEHGLPDSQNTGRLTSIRVDFQCILYFGKKFKVAKVSILTFEYVQCN